MFTADERILGDQMGSGEVRAWGFDVSRDPRREAARFGMSHQNWLWAIFSIGVTAMLAIDLGVFNRRAHPISRKEALGWSILWILISLAFSWGVSAYISPQKGLEFLTGYILEKSLSVDNLFVFIIIFSYFKVKPEFQHRVLYWGIIGALVMRGILIAAGSILIGKFQWILYLFGAFLVYTAIRMALHGEDDGIEPAKNPVVRFFRRFIPVTETDEGSSFFVRREGKWMATPLIVVVIVVETTDLVFATDSIPAIFGVTNDSFIVYTSNVFAILGLRALYFLVAGIVGLFRFLKFGIALVLGFIGVKMLLKDFWHFSTAWSLGIVGSVLAISVLLSIVIPEKK